MTKTCWRSVTKQYNIFYQFAFVGLLHKYKITPTPPVAHLLETTCTTYSKTFNWQWNKHKKVLILYILFHYYMHLPLLCKHDSLHKQQTAEKYVNTTAHNTCWLEFFQTHIKGMVEK